MKSVHYTMINRIEKEIIGNSLEILVISSFTTSHAKFNKFNTGNVVLFQVKVKEKVTGAYLGKKSRRSGPLFLFQTDQTVPSIFASKSQ